MSLQDHHYQEEEARYKGLLGVRLEHTEVPPAMKRECFEDKDLHAALEGVGLNLEL